MPKLEDTRETITTSIPSIEESEVTLKKGLKAGSFEKIYKKEDRPRLTCSFMSLVEMIEDWNLEDDKGKKLEINLENVRKLKLDDVMSLLSEADFFKGRDFLKPEEQE